MELQTETHGETLVITASGARIDAAGAIDFKDKMRKLTEFGPDKIELNLASVEFIDSSGLGAVVASMKQLPMGKTLCLLDLTPTVAKVFRLTRMDSVFEIRTSNATDGDTRVNAS
ncbi:STAS domain-containing protein [Halocynthiibacter namhaensis]|uniref:STAS domain-containing protein n=1 Tax=Halocynthiibacter namhaensis TaxID=1290553 RepID=UPI00057958CE|nr:STAS domain-containing protein [Halocynthiibacter namhaensis]